MDAEKPFARLLADIPEALAQDKAFVDELESNARVITLKKGDLLLHTPAKSARMLISSTKGFSLISSSPTKGRNVSPVSLPTICILSSLKSVISPRHLPASRSRHSKTASSFVSHVSQSKACRSAIRCLPPIISTPCS